LLLLLLHYCNHYSNNSIISMEKGGNCKSVFARFCDISAALKKSAEADGTKLMYSEKLGYLGTCPSNLGTGLRLVLLHVHNTH
jgi:protein-arginine kinase